MAATLHHKEAQYELAKAYLKGRGVEKSEQKAQALLEGLDKHPKALRRLGLIYLNLKDLRKAHDTFSKAAEMGDIEACEELYMLFFENLNFGTNMERSLSFYYLMKAAKANSRRACARLGFGYLFGKDLNGFTFKQDPALAVEWYEHSAALGYGRAFCRLGTCYENGWGYVKSNVKALENYKKAEQLGDDLVLFNLGLIYLNGMPQAIQVAEVIQDLPKNEKLGFEYLLKAANKNQEDATYEVAKCWSLGRGTPMDMDIALTWYKKAAEKGYESARVFLSTYYKEQAEKFKPKA
jgi:hypothetical protein